MRDGCEAGALVEGFVASGDPEAIDSREEVGSGADNDRVSESKSGSDNGVITEGREAARGARLRPGWCGAGRKLASASGVAHDTRNGIGIAERGAAKRPDVGSEEPDTPALDERTG